MRILAATFLLAISFSTALVAQTPPKSEKEILAQKEFEEGRRLYAELSGTSQTLPQDVAQVALKASLEHFKNASTLYHELGMRRNEGFSLAWIGRLSSWTGDNATAIKSYEQAIAIFDELKDIVEVGRQFASLGLLYFDAKEYNKALAYYNKAVAAARSAKDPNLEELALSSLGQCYFHLFDRNAAIRTWEEAVKVAEGQGNLSDQAFTLKLIASAYDDAGERQKALAYYQRALLIYRRIGGDANRQLEAYTLRGMADIQIVLRNRRKALELDLEALQLLMSLNAQSSVADSLARVSSHYGNLGDASNALKYQKEAVKVQEIYGTKKDLSQALSRLAYVYRYNVRDVAQARAAVERSLSIATEINDKEAQAKAFSTLGDTYSDLPDGRVKEVEYKIKAYGLYMDAGEFEEAADELTDVGIATYFLDDYPKAAEYLNQAVVLYTALERPTSLARPLEWLAHTFSAAGNRKMATAYAKQALIGYQNLRRNIAGLGEAEQRGYLKGIEDNYRALVDLLLRQNRLKEAHQVLIAFKDEQSFDVTYAGKERKQVNITLTARESAFWKEYIDALKNVVAARKRSVELDDVIARGEANAETAKEKAQVREEFSKGWRGIIDRCSKAATEFAKPDDASDVVPDLKENTAMWKAIADVSQSTNQETVAVYQFVSDDRIDLLIVSRTEMRHVSTPVANLNEKARTLWALLQSDKYDPRPAAKEVYDVVFKPIEKELPAGTKTILWSLDGNLRYVPMAALYDGKQYLVERFNNVTFTRADAERLTRQASTKWRAAAFGSSEAHIVGDSVFSALPGVNSELKTLFGKRKPVVDGEVLIDAGFTKDALLKRLASKPPVVHIASHFNFRPGDEAGSFLLLGDGTPFTLADMKYENDLFAGVELLTLSACNTAAQQADANGREVDAFFELAQRLGAQSVLATLWPVADNSTPWLMREFYDLKVNKHENKAEALRNAQLALLRGSAKSKRATTRTDASQVKVVVEGEKARGELFVIPKKDAKPFVSDPARPFAHPFYWSPFVLIGNWR